jgi:hypothetical protein
VTLALRLPKWLVDWDVRLRRERPTLWHLQTAYVACFFALVTAIAVAAGFLVPVSNNAMTPVEPGFFAFLALSGAACCAWLIRLLRPLRWWQMSMRPTEPRLALAFVHGLALLAPAFVYGVIVEHRITRVIEPFAFLHV